MAKGFVKGRISVLIPDVHSSPRTHKKPNHPRVFPFNGQVKSSLQSQDEHSVLVVEEGVGGRPEG